ncbi:hypothetical protein HOF92_04025 [bacterium]|jgi:hypothetical protein|nr:hypothetical protein [bacterium]
MAQWEQVQNELESLFPTGEWVEADPGREGYCPYFLYRTWFLEMLISKRHFSENNLKALLNFQFNFSPTENVIFQKATAMGLLPFHFYSRLEARLHEIGVKIYYQLDADFSTPFQIQSSNLNELCATVSKLGSAHLEVTETALESLQAIAKKYSLG